MKYLSLLVPCALAQNRWMDVYWITSANSPAYNRPELIEKQLIPRVRNRFMLPRMLVWPQLLIARWHWWLYGEVSSGTCVKKMGVYTNFRDLIKLMEQVGEDVTAELSKNGTDHCGWDTTAYAMAEPWIEGFDIKYVVWENMIQEIVDAPPHPASVKPEDYCREGVYGHISQKQLVDEVPNKNYRLFTINYYDEETEKYYANYIKDNVPGIMYQGRSFKTANDPMLYNEKYWKDEGNNTALVLFLYLSRGVTYGQDELPINWDDQEHVNLWAHKYYNMHQEVHGPNATKPWKKTFYLEDDHPDNLAHKLLYKGDLPQLSE